MRVKNCPTNFARTRGVTTPTRYTKDAGSKSTSSGQPRRVLPGLKDRQRGAYWRSPNSRKSKTRQSADRLVTETKRPEGKGRWPWQARSSGRVYQLSALKNNNNIIKIPIIIHGYEKPSDGWLGWCPRRCKRLLWVSEVDPYLRLDWEYATLWFSSSLSSFLFLGRLEHPNLRPTHLCLNLSILQHNFRWVEVKGCTIRVDCGVESTKSSVLMNILF
jgi:hypothetical protein